MVTINPTFFALMRAYLYKEKIPSLTEKEIMNCLQLAQIHSLYPIIYYVIKQEKGICFINDKLEQVYKTMLYQAIVQDEAITEIRKAFENENIKIILFKGAEIREFYPIPQHRTMGDLDCLIKKEDREKADRLFASMGFECKECTGDVWKYVRGVVIIELHVRIASNNTLIQFDYNGYFFDAINHAEKKGYYWCFEVEYHLCYLLYHITKHLCGTGAGIRMVFDIAIFIQNYEEKLNWKKVEKMLKETKLNLLAGAIFQLCIKWFGVEVDCAYTVSKTTLSELERYMIEGGTFGHQTHDYGDVYRRNGYTKIHEKNMYMKIEVIKNFLFPPINYMIQVLPIVRKYKFLLPLAWIKRYFLALAYRRRDSLEIIKSLARKDEGRAIREYRLLKELGL